MKEEDREAKAAVWLQRLREAAAAKEPLVEYAPVLDRPHPGVRGYLGIPHATHGPGQWAHEYRQE